LCPAKKGLEANKCQTNKAPVKELQIIVIPGKTNLLNPKELLRRLFLRLKLRNV